MLLYHSLPVDPTVIILQEVCGLVLEKAGLSVGVLGNTLLLGSLLEGAGGLGKDAGRPGPWGLWERKEEVSPVVPWGRRDHHLLGPRHCPGALSQMGGRGRSHPALVVRHAEVGRRLLNRLNQIYPRQANKVHPALHHLGL